MVKRLLTLFFILFNVFLYSQSFTSLWNTANTSPGSSANNEIRIPTNPAFTTYNYTVDWGDGTTDTGITGNITHTYGSPGIYTIGISGVFPSIYFNDSGDRNKIIEILSWGAIQWQTMENAFFGCENINFDAIDSPNLSQVTSLKNMFRRCLLFNGIVNNWNVSTITDISGLFAEALIFNRPLDTWNTINVTDMSWAFHRARQFNEPLDNWNTASVTTMEYLFSETSSFNQNINNWDVSQVTNMSGTFRYTGRFDQPLNNWIVNAATDMSGMFQGSAFNRSIANWNVSNVTNMSAMFRESLFNHPIEIWNVSNVTNMMEMFHRHRTYNHPLNNWDVSNVTNMGSMFDGWVWGAIYNQPLNNWDVSNVTNMSYMFRDNSGFNQDISAWDVSNVTSMRGMFEQNTVFNQNISSWDVSSVTDMANMFNQAAVYNQPLDAWQVGNVTDMNGMFYRALMFNQPINSWDVSKVTSMLNMFRLNPEFDQPLTNWNTVAVTNMSGMFQSAESFDQNLASWNMANVTNMTDMLSGSGLSQANYDDTLIGWGAQTVRNNVSLGALDLNYCDGRIARQELVDNNNWNISGDIINCTFVLCTNLTSPLHGDTNVPASANLVWEPTPGATGYRVTVRIMRGGIESIPFADYDVNNNIALNLETPLGADLLAPGDEVFVTVVPYNNTDGPAIGCTEESFTVVPSWVNSPDAFKLTYDTRITDSDTTPANQLKIEAKTGAPDNLTYDYSIDWGDDQFDNNVTGNITHTYLTPGIYTVSIIGNFPAPYHNYSNTDNIKLLSIDQWGIQAWQSMERAFYSCTNMEYNATDIPDLSGVTNMSGMFNGCSLFNGDINNWDVSNVSDMSSTFIGAAAFNQPLNSWDVSNVSNFFATFLGARSFNQPLNGWDTSSALNMSRMFEQTREFNQNINNWEVGNVTNMAGMFDRAVVYNQPLNGWNVGNVTDMSKMFANAALFNQPLASWNVGNVTLMNEMFADASVFNQPLNSWDVGKATNMFAMFIRAHLFNQSLNNWNVTNVTNMGRMFYEARVFDQNINSWNVTNVINTGGMFQFATAFNQPLNNWDVDSVVNMVSMFQGAANFNQPLNNWDVSAVANMSSMFERAVLFNQPLDNWDVSSVTLMGSMFKRAERFNSSVGTWDVASVTNMEAMFNDARVFNQPIDNWDTGEVLTMQEMFSGASAFNSPIGNWNVSYVTTMARMFQAATVFNRPLNDWNVASVTTMDAMFSGATAFNQPIEGWNVRSVRNMQSMFTTATSFNQPLNNWRVSGVTNMNFMFRFASVFNQPLNQWDLGTVSMRGMFDTAGAYNQYLGDWNISGVSDMLNMLDNTILTLVNYDNTLIAWSEQNLTSGINLGARGLPYCDALEERQSMISNYGWTISNDVLDCPIPVCTQLTSPLNGDTDVPLNTNLSWEPALYARGYRLTVEVQPSGAILVNNVAVNDTSYEFTTDFNTGDIVYVTLVPFNDTGDAVGPCTQESFSILGISPTVPECTILTEPLNNATDVAIGTNLSWGPISNADGYRITVGTTLGGIDILNNQNVGNITTYNLPNNLYEDTDIFVTITPYNEEGDAITCTEESFRTEIIPVPPVCTSLSSPLNGTTGVPLDTDLSWNAVVGATGYLVRVGTTQGGIEVANNIDVLNATTYTFPSLLQQNRTHYVTIIPYNNVGDATGCLEQSFRTGNSTLSDPPACTTLNMPLNNATDVPLATNITWNAAANATGYTVTVGTSTGGSDLYSGNMANVTTLNLTDDLPENTEIFVTITPYNTFGSATGCAEERFSTVAALAIPECATLSSPLNGSTDVLPGFILEWNAVPNADGYYLTVTTTSGANDVTDQDLVGGGAGVSYGFGYDFNPGEVVTVTLVPYNAAGSAVGCSSETFTLMDIPECTNLTAPLNGATNVSVSTDLSWEPVANASGYRFTIGTTSGGTDILSTTAVGNITNFNIPSALPENTEIFVTIVPFNSLDDAIGCIAESFTTETVASLPTCTSLTAPLNGATDVYLSSNMTWNSVPNADGYRLTIGTSPGGNDILDNTDIGNLLSYDPPSDFAEDTEVFVTLIPYNGVGDAMGCSEERFVTVSAPMGTVPSCTTLNGPLHLDMDVAIATNLSWNALTDADGYTLSVGTSSGANDILNGEDVGDVLVFDLPNDLPENTEIFVSVIPYNANGAATGCTEERFITETLASEPELPSCTSINLPMNGDTNVSLNTTIRWNALGNVDGYVLTIGTSDGGTDVIDALDLGLTTSYELVDNLPAGEEIFVSIVPYKGILRAENCGSQSFFTVSEEPEEEEDLTLYGFSPNGDNLNDFWVIDGIENSPDNTVSIYNRWGDMVFQVQGYDNAANAFYGTANKRTNMGANELPSGTYFFSIEVTGSHNLKKLQGYLVIKR